MTHRFEITLSEDDLVEAFRLNARFRKLRPLVATFVFFSVLLIVVLLFSPAARLSAQYRPLTLLLEGALGILFLIATCLFALTGRIWRIGARRSLAQRQDLSRPIQYEVDDEALRHTTCFSDSAYPWAALRAWNESDRLFLIYVADALFYPIPKAQAPESGIAAIRNALILAGVPRR